jgi:hypothetical protein
MVPLFQKPKPIDATAIPKSAWLELRKVVATPNTRKRVSMKNLMRRCKLSAVREVAKCNKEKSGKGAECPSNKCITEGILVNAAGVVGVFELPAITCGPNVEEFERAALS